MIARARAVRDPEVGWAGRRCRESASQGLAILAALYPATAQGQRCMA